MTGSVNIMVRETDEGVNVATEMRLRDVGLLDKFALLNALCNGLRMSQTDKIKWLMYTGKIEDDTETLVDRKLTPEEIDDIEQEDML